MKFLVLLFLLAPICHAANWDQILDQNGGAAKVQYGASFQGPQPYTRNSEIEFLPASTAKILTAAAAVYYLGENFRYETKLQWKRIDAQTVGQVQLIGSGDPTWGMSEFGESLTGKIKEIAAKFSEQGIKYIEGDIQILANDPRWNNLRYPQGWKSNDKVACYGSTSQHFNLNANCAVLQVRSAQSANWIERGVATPIEIALTSGSSTSVSICNVGAIAPSPTYKICGTWKKGASTRSFVLPIPNSGDWVKKILREEIVKLGIEFHDPNATGNIESFSFYSVPLSEILKPFLKNSIGIIGETIFKTIGSHYDSQQFSDLNEAGREAILNYLTRNGIRTQDMNVFDGSGLSRFNRASPSFSMEFLSFLANQTYFSQIWSALAVAGVDGTLRNRMKGSVAQGVLRGKTGTLDGVYNLVGYIPNGKGYTPFVLLSQTTTSYSSTVRGAANQIGIELTKLIKPRFFTPETISVIPFIPEHAGPDGE